MNNQTEKFWIIIGTIAMFVLNVIASIQISIGGYALFQLLRSDVHFFL